MTGLRKTAYSNISNCFPEKKQPQVTLLVKQHFEAIGISLFETANAYYASDKKIKKLTMVQIWWGRKRQQRRGKGQSSELP